MDPERRHSDWGHRLLRCNLPSGVRRAILISLWPAILATIGLSGCDQNRTAAVKTENGFDDQGRLVYKIAPDNQRTDFRYDDVGRLSGIDFGKVEADFWYDEVGSLVGIRDETGTTQQFYDAFGRIAGVLWEHSPSRLTLYGYDPWGRITQMEVFDLDRIRLTGDYNDVLQRLRWESIDQSARFSEYRAAFNELIGRLRQETVERQTAWRDYRVGYAYDILGNLRYVDTERGRIEYDYDIRMRRVDRRLPNGISSSFEYDQSGQLVRLRHQDQAQRLISEYYYEYGPSGQLQRYTESDATDTKTFETVWNHQGRLAEYRHPELGTFKYEYDKNGARARIEAAGRNIDLAYTDLGELRSAGEASIRWNDNGSIKDCRSEGHRSVYRYDDKGYLSFARTPRGTARLRWDVGGNLLSMQLDDRVTHYLPNFIAPAGQTLLEYDDNGEVMASYIYSEGLIAGADASHGVLYYLEDGLSSIRYAIDGNGKIAGQYNYDPLGKPTVVEGELPPQFRSVGQRYIENLGAYVVNRRIYDPTIGQYVTPDPSPAKIDCFAGYGGYTPSLADDVNLADRGYGCFAGLPFQRRPAQVAWWERWGKSLYGDALSVARRVARERGLTNWSRSAASGVNWTLAFADPVTAQAGRIMYGGPWWTWDDMENYARAILTFWASAYGESQLPGGGGIAGKYAAKAAAGAAAGFGRFLGSRWDRPESIFSWRWWMPTADYQALVDREAQGLIDQHKVYDPAGGERKAADSPDRRSLRRGRRAWDDPTPYYAPLPCPPFCPDGGRPGGALFPPPCPPFCGGPGGPSPAANRPDDGSGPFGFGDPIETIETQLGGIELSAEAEFYGDIGNITGAVYDPRTSRIILTGDRDLNVPSLKARDFAVALLCEYGYGEHPPCDPQFSLDPADPRNPEGEYLKTVYYPEVFLAGTEFGETMFETDWLLKQYCFGVIVDGNGRVHERMSSVPGFKSKSDLYFEHPFTGPSQVWSRSWIVSDSMLISTANDAIVFDVATMRVLTRKQVPDPTSPTGLRDVNTEEDPIATEFARLFTQLYDQIAGESPEFERLRQLAKIGALVKWLRKRNVPVDLEWAARQLDVRDSVVTRVGALSQTRLDTSGVYIRTLHQFGGVDLTAHPRFRAGERQTRKLGEAVQAALSSSPSQSLFVLPEGLGIAAVLPVTADGRRAWSDAPTVEIDGTVYSFDNQGQVTRSLDGNGILIDYEYDTHGDLTGLGIQHPDGSHTRHKFEGNRSIWKVETPQKDEYQLIYDRRDGRLASVDVNGEQFSTFQYDESGRTIAATYADFTETSQFDSHGRLIKYGITNHRSGLSEEMGMTRNSSGDLVAVRLGNNPILEIERAAGNQRQTKVRLGEQQVIVSYDDRDRVVGVDAGLGERIAVTYGGDDEVTVSADKAGVRSKYVFDEYGLASADDAFGHTELGRDQGRLVSAASPITGQINLSYDARERPAEAKMPDGSIVRYKYSLGTRGSGDATHAVVVTRTGRGYKANEATGTTGEPVEVELDLATRAARRKDNVAAVGMLKRGAVLDLEVVGDGRENHLEMVGENREIVQVSPEAAGEFQRLLRLTARVKGKIGESLQRKWQAFYQEHLAGLATAEYRTQPDGRQIKLKPALIIRSNEIEKGFANLDRVRALSENFIVMIAARYRVGGRLHESTATELAQKVNNLPRLRSDNVLAVIRTPEDLTRSQRQEWERAVSDLSTVAGRDRVVFDPSKSELEDALADKGSEVVVIEVTHTDQGIVLKDGYRYGSSDVTAGSDLSHVKGLITGMGTCDLPGVQNGEFINALLSKGTGLISFSSGSVSAETALHRLLRLIEFLRESEGEIGIPTQNLQDVIDQLEDIQNEPGGIIGEVLDVENGSFVREVDCQAA